jgi:hypothetical protein
LISTLAALLIAPAAADAQRRAVPRVIRSRPAVSVGLYYGPSIYYRPWYASGYYGRYYGGWYDPFSYYAPFYGGYPYYAQYPYYGRGYYDLSSSLRLQVSPKEAEVFIDGYYAGTVDNFDGIFQRLHLEPGEHDLELFLPGHRSFTQKIYLQPLSTFRVRHTMEPLRAGEPEPVRPAAAAPPQGGAVSRTGPERSPSRAPQRPLPPRARDRDRDRDPDRDRDRGGNVEPRETAADFGSLALRVQPGDAVITIDGERWQGGQDNDRLVVQLGPGRHTVEIRKDGYRTYITDITVQATETTTLNVSLTRQ